MLNKPDQESLVYLEFAPPLSSPDSLPLFGTIYPKNDFVAPSTRNEGLIKVRAICPDCPAYADCKPEFYPWSYFHRPSKTRFHVFQVIGEKAASLQCQIRILHQDTPLTL